MVCPTKTTTVAPGVEAMVVLLWIRCTQSPSHYSSDVQNLRFLGIWDRCSPDALQFSAKAVMVNPGRSI